MATIGRHDSQQGGSGTLTDAPDRPDQVGALVWRPASNRYGFEILLITSLGTGRWIIPKGWQKRDKSARQSAAEEAWEEAGINGVVSEAEIGRFDYDKHERDGTRVLTVRVFELAFSDSSKAYPEKDRRRRIWLDPGKAAAMVQEKDLRWLIRRFEPTLALPGGAKRSA